MEEGKIGIDDIVASATSGVLRALDARKFGAERFSVPELVKSGFTVDILIRAGGPFAALAANLPHVGGPAIGGQLGQQAGGMSNGG